jgi:NAD+ synthase (glutamine-hydrolysing)
MKILAAQLNPTIGDFEENSWWIIEALAFARRKRCELVIFPELAICGYPPEDLLLHPDFVETCEKFTKKIARESKGLSVVLGTVRRAGDHHEKPLHNSAAIIVDGKIIGYQDKQLLPTYDVFDEHRYFEPGRQSQVWKLCGKKVAITVCEDLWAHAKRLVFTEYTCDPVDRLKHHEPDLHINISSSPFSMEKRGVRLEVVAYAARTLHCPTIWCNQVGGNDSLIFDGHSLVVDKDGNLRQEGHRFSEDLMVVDLDHLPPAHELEVDETAELYHALVLGLHDYCRKSGFEKALLGLSGGIDSAVVAVIAVAALGHDKVYGVCLPSRYSSEHSVDDAQELARNLKIETKVIPIEEPHAAFEKLLTPHFDNKPPDSTEENLQARTRGMIIMALSNKHGHLVLSTGNKSEMATGYATLYGDMCGGLSVINDVSKLQVYELARWINEHEGHPIPENIITKPPSAELAADQLDSDNLPPYAIVDAVLEGYVEKHLSPSKIATEREIDLDIVNDLVRRIHRNEYKRRQAPPGLRVTEKAFSVGRRSPIVQRWR